GRLLRCEVYGVGDKGYEPAVGANRSIVDYRGIAVAVPGIALAVRADCYQLSLLLKHVAHVEIERVRSEGKRLHDVDRDVFGPEHKPSVGANSADRAFGGESIYFDPDGAGRSRIKVS